MQADRYDDGLKRRVDIVTPLRPAKSGIADYVEDLLPSHSLHWDARILVETEAQAHPVEGAGTVEILRPTTVVGMVPTVVHIGNNPDHLFAFLYARRHPCLIVLHDFNLHHLVVEATLARGDKASYRTFLFEQYGELGERVADQRENWAFSEFQQFIMPINRPAIRRAKGVVVHSKWAAKELAHSDPSVPVAVVPHLFNDANINSKGSVEAKLSFGLPTDSLVIGALGFVTPPKQVELLLKASSCLDEAIPWRVLIAGEASDLGKLSALISELEIGDRVTVTGYVTTERFRDALAACDIVSNLRYPSAGETSGVLVRALGAGKCCLVFRYGPFLDFPEDCIVSTPLDTDSPAALAETLSTVLKDCSMRQAIAARAASYIRSQHSPVKCAQLYDDFLDQVYGDAK